MPAVLTISAVVGCPAGGDDVGDDGSSSVATTDASTSSATTTMTSSPTSTMSATDSASSDPSSSSADSSSGETGELPICTDLPDEPTCATESQCIWLPELGGCTRNCEMITDLAVCMSSPGCVVYGDTCGYEPIS